MYLELKFLQAGRAAALRRAHPLPQRPAPACGGLKAAGAGLGLRRGPNPAPRHQITLPVAVPRPGRLRQSRSLEPAREPAPPGTPRRCQAARGSRGDAASRICCCCREKREAARQKSGLPVNGRLLDARQKSGLPIKERLQGRNQVPIKERLLDARQKSGVSIKEGLRGRNQGFPSISGAFFVYGFPPQAALSARRRRPPPGKQPVPPGAEAPVVAGTEALHPLRPLHPLPPTSPAPCRPRHLAKRLQRGRVVFISCLLPLPRKQNPPSQG